MIIIPSKHWTVLFGTLAGTNTPGQSGPGSNDNEGVLQIRQTPILKPDTVECHKHDTK